MFFVGEKQKKTFATSMMEILFEWCRLTIFEIHNVWIIIMGRVWFCLWGAKSQ